MLGGAPGAAAAPVKPSEGPATAAPQERNRSGGRSVPAVWPRPHDIRAQGRSVPVGTEVALVAAEGVDPHALEALREVLRSAGAEEVGELAPGAGLPSEALVVRAGGPGAEEALRGLRAPLRADLPAGGYRLAVGRFEGRDTVALSGEGPDGLFHAVQTLRQLVVGPSGGGERATIAGAVVRDWPGIAERGTTEGFYGTPWTPRERLAHLDFLGRTKQNHFLYAPGDDAYRQARWRDPYPAEQRAAFRELADRARRNHVTLGWAVAPGQALCFADEDDLRALNRKLDAMWALGVRSFQLQFQDVSYDEWHCGEDRDRFGSGPRAAARAQAHFANAVAEHLARRHPGSAALTLMPTEYYQDGQTEYRRALSKALSPRVRVAWTGVGVVPRTITGSEVATARQVFAHPLVTVDNYPVNDYARDRIFLGPYTGREPGVATGSEALLANAMEQPTASRIPLFTAADYAWNPRGYRPADSWRAAVDDLAGADPGPRAALRALAGNDASSVLGAEESAYLRPLIEAVWRSDDGDDAERFGTATERLRKAFGVMRGAPRQLSEAQGGALAREVGPWLEQLARYGEAGQRAVDVLLALRKGDGAAAWRAELEVRRLRKAIGRAPETVGEGVLDPFLDRTLARAEAWSGGANTRPESSVEAGGTEFRVSLGRPRPLEAVTVLTSPTGDGAGRRTAVEVRVPGEGWRRIGPLSGSGWTELPARGVRADAVRLSWPQGARPPEVHRLAPWHTDNPDARSALEREETDVEIGGGPQQVLAELTSDRPREVRGRLRAKAPRGITVDLPERVSLRRGAKTSLPVRVRAEKGTPPGSYRVPLDLAGQTRTLTVRVSHRTGGPDLARGAETVSSGEETADFPASAAVDGDRRTRWSSPAEDGAWLQVELDRPRHLGQAVLHWQEAYAARYRIQVSADGRTWRTAATVRNGGGGREVVRFDAPGARFVRIQGERRATRFGYSLWSVELYAVASGDGPADDRGR
ncbi:beta-N-acetylglucosaminidase domain-containing protein [Streptomyces sp. TP-A0874]|uniref:beta-N-acetylglucosaminidase domain-containing protein n=1 Tax=Streptomyces sp. TP-A0874 TaxID=549819 RepID=UPI000852E5C3